MGQRQFNSEWYSFAGRHFTKDVAEADAKRLRSNGYKVRVVKSYQKTGRKGLKSTHVEYQLWSKKK